MEYVWITDIRQGGSRRHLLQSPVIISTTVVYVSDSAAAVNFYNSGASNIAVTYNAQNYNGNTGAKSFTTTPPPSPPPSPAPPPVYASNLWGAARSGSVYEVSTFLAFGTNVNARADKHDAFGTKGATALTEAAWNGAYDVVSYLIDVGANVNKKDSRKASPIHHAAKQGHSDVITLLIKSGAHIDARDKNNETPLHLAVNTQEEQTVQLLLEKGADVNAKAYDGDTPLDRSKKTMAGKRIAKLLKRYGGKNGRDVM